jgi:hypothetical protein
MFRYSLVATTFGAAIVVATFVTMNDTTAQEFIEPFIFDDTPPQSGYYYPGVPFANAYASPYYPGYGPPYYPGYGPPYTRNWGRDYLYPRYPVFKQYRTPYMATNGYYDYYGY